MAAAQRYCSRAGWLRLALCHGAGTLQQSVRQNVGVPGLLPAGRQAGPDGRPHGNAAKGEFHNGHNVIAFIGSYDQATHAFTKENVQLMDGGIDFYATQTTLARTAAAS